MAIPSAQGASQPIAPSFAPSFAAAGPIRFKSGNAAWTWMVSPSDLECIEGHVVPRLIKASHEPGVNGNGAALGRGEGAIAYFTGQGYRAVPHDTPATANGVVRTPNPSTYLNVWQGVDSGERNTQLWRDAWDIPVQLGNQTHWRRDTEGWLALRRSLAGLVGIGPGGTMSSEQVEIAIAPLLTALSRDAAVTQTPAVKARVKANLAQLPKEFHQRAGVAELTAPTLAT
jgi:hypothetical protein